MHVVIEASLDIALSLRLLKALIVIGLKLDKRLENVLVLFGVPVPQKYWLHSMLLLLFLSAQVCYLGLRFLLPELFQFVDFLWFNLERTLELNLRRVFNKPAENRFIFDEWLPVFHVPLAVFD